MLYCIAVGFKPGMNQVTQQIQVQLLMNISGRGWVYFNFTPGLFQTYTVFISTL